MTLSALYKPRWKRAAMWSRRSTKRRRLCSLTASELRRLFTNTCSSRPSPSGFSPSVALAVSTNLAVTDSKSDTAASVPSSRVSSVPERIFYRFATEDSLEDGELAPLPDFAATINSLVEVAKGCANETPLAENVLKQVFVNNGLSCEPVSEQSLSRLIRALLPITAEFQFLQGFL